jgi:hypothetical protein
MRIPARTWQQSAIDRVVVWISGALSRSTTLIDENQTANVTRNKEQQLIKP